MEPRILRPGASLLFMKVGTHAQESLEDIIARKRREIEDAGFALWGYGGATCHPLSMVQPFAREVTQRGSTVYLCMEEMQSHHFAVPERAKEFSVDGIRWQAIPGAINVLGSRYALPIRNLQEGAFELPLEHTRVAIGPNLGRLGASYVSGRVDKACLRVVDPDDAGIDQDEATSVVRSIGLVAELVDPFAVFVRN